MKPVKPIYGLSESGEYWGKTFRNNVENDLVMISCTSDAALFYKHLGYELEGVCRIYFDDPVHAGSTRYEKTAEKTKGKSTCKDRELVQMQFAGLKISSSDDTCTVHENSYILKLEKLIYEKKYA